MPRLDPDFLTEQQCKEIATRQILSFITLYDTKAEPPPHQRRASGESLFSFDALPDGAFGKGPALFNWMSHDIYDVDGLLLFRDQALDIGSGYEWCVRVAASDLLRTPVYCINAESRVNIEALKERALAELRNLDLEPLIVKGEKAIRIVSYSYPNPGILCYSQADPTARFVIDLWDLTILPVNPYERPENPESLTAIWSPYDIVVRSTIAQFRWLWKRNMALLPELPKSRKGLPNAIRKARAYIPGDQMTTPALSPIPQKASNYCAAATAQMIFEQHGEKTFTQVAIADAMQIVAGGDGATPENQVAGINKLVGTKLRAELDDQPSPEKAQCEILADRPFKIGSSIHARAVGGFRVEAGNKTWLHILNPSPTNQGSFCYEPWDVNPYSNFMYVRPLKFEPCSFR
jgi:hypothetical protein